MVYRVFIICCFFLFAKDSLGQSLKIKLVDSASGEPIVMANVFLYTPSDTGYAVSGEDGVAVFPKAPEKGKVYISHLVYGHTEVDVSGKKSLTIPLSEKDVFIKEYVVTGQANPSLSSRSIRPVRVITHEQLEKQAAVNLKDVLTHELNFRVTQDLITGSQVNLQGLSGQKVKILVDGVPVIGRVDGNIDLEQINVNNIDHIEIVEGPLSVEYGTDAMAGTINIITKKNVKKKFNNRLNTYYESVGRYNLDLLSQFSIIDNQITVGLGRNFFNGYSPIENARDQLWNPKEQYFASASVQHRFGSLLLRLKSDFFKETIQNKGSADALSPIIVPDSNGGATAYPRAFDDYYYTTRFNNAAFADFYAKNNQKVDGFVSYNYYERIKNSYQKNLSTGEEKLLPTTGSQDTTKFNLLISRLNYSNEIKPLNLEVRAGSQFSYEENKGIRIEGLSKEITEVAFFSTLNYTFDSALSIQPGLRYIYNSHFEAPLISSLSLKYDITPSLIFRASIAQGYRAPNLKELYFYFVDENHNILGNPDLKAEKSLNYQTSFHFTKSFTTYKFETSVSAFYNDIKDEIRLISIITPDKSDPRGEFRNENVDRSKTAGINFNFNNKWNNFESALGASIIGNRNNVAIENNIEDYNFYPGLDFNASYHFKKIGLEPSIFVNYTGKRKDLVLVQSNTEDYIPVTNIFADYALVDITLQKRFFKNKFIVSVGVKNLTDFTELKTSNPSSGVHSSGDANIPISYGRTYFGRVQIKL